MPAAPAYKRANNIKIILTKPRIFNESFLVIEPTAKTPAMKAINPEISLKIEAFGV